MDYREVLEKARQVMGPNCRVCPECNGIACKGEIPGLGGIGSGNSFIRTRDFLKSIRILMDVTYEAEDIDTSIELFDKKFEIPFFLAPIGGMKLNYNGYFKEEDYFEIIIKSMIDVGAFSFTPDGTGDEVYYKAMDYIKENNGLAVPTIKPWGKDKILEKINAAKASSAIAVACDIDSCGNLNLKNAGMPVYPMGQETIGEIVKQTQIPFIMKGIMTSESAIKCANAGCYAIVVSNHGGRVIEDSPAPAEMLPEIRKAVGYRMKIFVDGGIRTGRDVFKCLALGADAVLIGRPYVIAAHGGKTEGIKLYTEKILSELKDIMFMTGCKKLSDITIDKIRY